MPARLLAMAMVHLGLLACALGAQEGISENEVRFAQVARMEGPFGVLGREFRDGLLAAFAEVNEAGGIHGRRVFLDSFDDGNEPENTVDHVRRLVRDDAHLGFVGAAGVQSARVVQPIVKKSRIPFLAPASGDPFLRKLAMAHVRTLRPSVDIEAEAWIGHLVDDSGMDRVSVLYQNDLSGLQGVEAVEAALDLRGLSISSKGSYPRNTLAVKTALLKIRKARPQVVILLGEHAPIEAFVDLAVALDFNPVFVASSTISPASLVDAIGPYSGQVIATYAMPDPFDDETPVARSYRSAIGKQDGSTDPGILSFEGYLAGRYVAQLLDTAGPNLDRASFHRAMRRLRDVDLGGISLTFGLGDNQGLDKVRLARLTPDGTFEPL